ncbi:MAG: 2,3,4,5-tetrahydropyridine-2,6-dicarboxylate N-succinyltransferase, partial [Pseudomonadota bacterium]
MRSEIEAAWDDRDHITTETDGAARAHVEAALELLDAGELRVASKED